MKRNLVAIFEKAATNPEPHDAALELPHRADASSVFVTEHP